MIQIVGERANEARRKLIAIAGRYAAVLDPSVLALGGRRVMLPSHARIGLLDLEGVSHRTATKAVRRLLTHGQRMLIVVFAHADLTPLRLARGTRLLYVDAADVVDSIGHEKLLPAAAAPEEEAEPVPTAAEVRRGLLRGLLQRWLAEKSITPHQRDMEPPQHLRTVPLRDVVKELKSSALPVPLPSLAPTQREVSAGLERLGFSITNHSNTLMLKTWRPQ